MNMYRIILVDDEEEVRKGIIRKIQWEKLGFTIVGDAIDSMLRENGEEGTFFNREHPKAMSELNNMYVTSKDIDETVKRLSFPISEAINMALEIT